MFQKYFILYLYEIKGKEKYLLEHMPFHLNLNENLKVVKHFRWVECGVTQYMLLI